MYLTLLCLGATLAHLYGIHLRPSEPACRPRDYATGNWVPKDPPLQPNSSVVDVFQASGFEGCAQMWFKPHWFFGTKLDMNMEEYRWNAAQYRWKSDSEVCEREAKTEAMDLLQDLVSRGGWLLMGDSLSEQHFFSLGCTLFPHVEVRWGVGWQEQFMYLNPNSPALASLVLPANFSIEKTPIISQFRTDHGFEKQELYDIYAATPQANVTPASQLFTSYPVQSPPIDNYFQHFTDPANHYSTLIFSTAGHYTVREFAFPDGQPAILPFYEAVATTWADRAAEYLRNDTAGREVIVRAASSGHDDCHSHMAPLKEMGEPPKSYNWAEIPKMNAIFEDVVEKVNHPRLHFLPIEQPGQLRPDGHSGDCLHMAVGVGIFEGYTDYLAYFLRSRTPLPRASATTSRPSESRDPLDWAKVDPPQ
ncbi:hypothetical protein JCM5296_006688 [Sporobolomyces johnsonii]